MHGASFSNGPAIVAQAKNDAGWDIQPVRHWDWTDGRPLA